MRSLVFTALLLCSSTIAAAQSTWSTRFAPNGFDAAGRQVRSFDLGDRAPGEGSVDRDRLVLLK